MLNSPLAPTVAGWACVGGAVCLLAAGGSVLVAACLLLGARTLLEPAARGWVAAMAPVWAAAVVAAAWRAGSSDLGDIRGAHAVLGAGLLRGDWQDVASLWLALLACVAAAGMPRGTGAQLAWFAQALLAVALVCGPQVRDAGDAVVWAAVVAVAGAQVVAERVSGPAARLGVARAAAAGAVLLGALA